MSAAPSQPAASAEVISARTGRSGLVRTGSAAALVGLVGAVHVGAYFGPFEDSYITYRYAENAARGLGLVYNAGERVEGFSSLSWTVLLAALAGLGAPLPVVAPVLSVACAVALLWLTGRVARTLEPRGSTAWLFAPALLACSGTLAYYAGTGMETPLFAALILASTTIASREGAGGGAALGATLGLAALTRPEGAGYAVAILLPLAATADSRRRLVRGATVFAAVFAALLAFRLAYYGELLPNTYHAKASPSAALLRGGLAYVEEHVVFWGGAVGAAAVMALAFHGPPSLPGTRLFFRVSASVVAASCANAILVGGDTFMFHRVLLPSAPLFAVAIAHGAQRLVEAGTLRRPVAAFAVLALAAWSAAAALVPRVSLTARRYPPFAQLARAVWRLDEQYAVVGRWLREHAPPESVMATNAAGIVPYWSGLQTIDMLGLTDSYIAHRPIALGQGFHGHEKHDPEYVLGRGPDLILPGLPVLANRRLRVADLGAWYGQWAAYLPGDRKLLADPRLGERYVFWVAEVTRGQFLPLFVRRGSLAARRLPRAP
jgi:arabinofuranosyltransferase